MKTIKFTLWALVAVFVFSCGRDNEDEVAPVDIKSGLVGKIWRYTNITGKVKNGTIKDEITVFKDGKNQYGFVTDLSQETFQFDEDGIVWINSEEFKWTLSPDNKTIKISEDGDEDVLVLEILALEGNELKIALNGWQEIPTDDDLTSDWILNMDVIIIMNGQPVDPTLQNLETKLAGKTWKFSSISGKVIGGKVTGEVPVFKEGKNQYGFSQDLSKTTYIFNKDGDVEIEVSFPGNTQTTALKWGVSGDKRRIRMWRAASPDWILTDWEIKSASDSEIKVFEKGWEKGVTDKTLTESFNVKMDALLTLISK